jgi:hypothetical protein
MVKKPINRTSTGRYDLCIHAHVCIVLQKRYEYSVLTRSISSDKLKSVVASLTTIQDKSDTFWLNFQDMSLAMQILLEIKKIGYLQYRVES